jgi:hypothetical protein
MDQAILAVFGKAAGIGGLALGVLLLIFRSIIRKNIFPKLSNEHAFRLIRLILVFTFLISSLGIGAWVYASVGSRATHGGVDNIPPPPGPTIKHCAGEHSEVFTFPGVLQRDSAGNYIDLGDGGGGTRFYKWACSWPAPATVTFVKCTVGRNQHVLAENKNGSTAECEGNINGGNDPITMHIAWDGPCDQQ